MHVRQLDRVADLLDLGAETADRRVVDVGDLLEDELLDLGLGNLLVDVPRARLEQQRVAGAQALVHQRRREAYDPLVVGVPDHQGALTVGEHLLEHDDLADALERQRADHHHALVEHELLALAQPLELDLGAHGHPHLAAGGHDVGGAVVVRGEVDAEAGRRLGQPVDLFLERDDLVAGLPQRGCQALVLGRSRREFALDRGQLLLELLLLAALGHAAHLRSTLHRPYKPRSSRPLQ